MITQGNTLLTDLSPYFGTYGLFFGMVFAALLLGLTPLRYPFQWLETYYHELSHGLAALISGGKIGRIKLNLDGSGWCSTRGGSRFIILMAGYMGAALWGGYLYLAGWNLGVHSSQQLLFIELGIIAFTVVFWVRDPVTLLILASAAAVYAAPAYLPWLQPYVSFILQFTGIYIMLSAVRAPLHLIDGQHVGDGAALADLTFIFPEGVWILFWLLFSLTILFCCAVLTLPGLNWVLWWLT